MPFDAAFGPTPFRATFDVKLGGARIAVERPVRKRYVDDLFGLKRGRSWRRNRAADAGHMSDSGAGGSSAGTTGAYALLANLLSLGAGGR